MVRSVLTKVYVSHLKGEAARCSGFLAPERKVPLYLEQYSKGDINLDTQKMLKNVRDAAFSISEMNANIGRIKPDVIT
jgi:phosphoglucomutase